MMSDDAKKAINVLSQTQLDFIQEELGISKNSIVNMSDAEVLDMYDRICDIELEETIAADEKRGGEHSERELMAEGIVTVLGNELYRPEGEGEDLDLDDE